MFGIMHYLTSWLLHSHRHPISQSSDQNDPKRQNTSNSHNKRLAANHSSEHKSSRSTLLFVLILSLISSSVSQVPLFNAPSSGPLVQTSRRAEYLLGGVGFLSGVDSGAERAAAEVEILEDQLADAVRRHAITNARLAIRRGEVDEEFGIIHTTAFALITASDFIELGATLSGIGGGIVIEEITPEAEVGMVSEPIISTFQFNPSTGSTTSNQQSYRRVGNVRKTTFSGAHRQSRGRRTGHLENRNRQRSTSSSQSERLSTEQCIEAFMSSDYYGQHGKGLNGCVEHPEELSELAELIITSVALSVAGSGLILVAVAHFVIIERGQLNLAISINNLRLADYSERVTHLIEIERARANGTFPPEPSEPEDVVDTEGGPYAEGAEAEPFPDFFYGTWSSATNIPAPISDFWALSAAYANVFTYQSDSPTQTIRHLSFDDDHIRTTLETQSSAGQTLLSSNSLSEVRTRVVLKKPATSTNRTDQSNNQTSQANSRTQSNLGQSSKSSTSREPQSRRHIHLNDIDTIGIFLGWDQAASWHWYRYNRSVHTLTDANDVNQVFTRI